MDNPTAKRFNLIDAMVLVAATAAGLALGRAVTQVRYAHFYFVGGFVCDWVVSVLLVWTLAIFALNLSRYRTKIRDLASRPGFTAMIAIVVDRIFSSLHTAINMTHLYLNPNDPSEFDFSWIEEWLWESLVPNPLHVINGISTSDRLVATAWIVTAMAGCWRAEKTWIDRTGRVLGVFWLIVPLAFWLSCFIYHD